MKRALVWIVQSCMNLLPVVVLIAGTWLFLTFLPEYSLALIVLWLVVIACVWITYSRRA